MQSPPTERLDVRSDVATLRKNSYEEATVTIQHEKFEGYPDECPQCGVMFCYVPEHAQCPKPVGIYDRDKDRTVAWRCCDCGHEWERE